MCGLSCSLVLGPVLRRFARRAAGVLEDDVMFCPEKYATDRELAQDDLIRLEQPPMPNPKRTYMRRNSTADSVHAASPRQDDDRWSVVDGLREDRAERERRAR